MTFDRKILAAVYQTTSPMGQAQALLTDVGQIAKTKMELAN